MKQIDLTQVIFILTAMVLAFACTWAVEPAVQTTIKIGARHLAHKGMEKWPDQFGSLATISKSACELGKGNQEAIQGVFSVLARLVLQDLKDPLLKADLEDLIDLMGVYMNDDFEIRGVSPETQKILEVVVCEFAKYERR